MESYQFVNLTFLDHFTSGKKEMKIAFIKKFLETVQPAITEIEKYNAERDWKSLRTAAHSIKPQLSYMGIDQLEKVITRIEDNANDHINLDELPGLVEQLKNVCTQSCLELKQIITSLQ